jgi:hypothetical protein
MTYAIDSWAFSNWSGQPPRLVNQHLRIFTKPGQNDVSGQLMGIHGDPFDVELTSVYQYQEQVVVAENGYRFLVGASPVNVLYNNVNYFTQFSHRYLVLDVTMMEQKRLPRIINSLPGGYDYIGGWQLKTRWQLLPVVA